LQDVPGRGSDVADLVEEIDRLDELAEDLLFLAAADHPGDMIFSPVDVEDLVVAAARRWSRVADRVWRVDVQAEGMLAGDRQRLDTALDAALENALLATQRDDVVELSARREGTDVVLEVRDTGVGIPAELLPHVFDRFVTAARETSAARGTGLGLAIVKAVVDAHGGDVTIRSAPGAGTRLAMRLPMVARAQPEHEPVAPVAPIAR
jgi:signal transduction histidine kinase